MLIKFMFGAIFIAIFVFNSSLLVVLISGLLPTFICFLFYKSNLVAYAMGTLNFCGVVPYLIIVVTKELNFYATISLIMSTRSLFIMYFAGCIGFLLASSVSDITKSLIQSYYKKKRTSLVKDQTTLLETWGNDVM